MQRIHLSTKEINLQSVPLNLSRTLGERVEAVGAVEVTTVGVAVVRVESDCRSFPSRSNTLYNLGVDAVLSVSSIFPLDLMRSVRDDVSSRTQSLSRISPFVSLPHSLGCVDATVFDNLSSYLFPLGFSLNSSVSISLIERVVLSNISGSNTHVFLLESSL